MQRSLAAGADVLDADLWMTADGVVVAHHDRDIAGDTGKSVRTVASLLGDRGSLYYYGFLIFAPYVLVLLMIAATRYLALGPVMPATFVLTLLALPLSLRLWKRALQRAAREAEASESAETAESPLE